MKFIFRLLVLLPIFVFFLATAPGNRSDADMAFDHAQRVEHGIGRVDVHYPLYVPLMRGLFLALRAAGVVRRAYPMMTVLSAACAAATVYLFFLFCYHRFSLRPLSSLFAAGFFLFSHGVWRYAAEAEPMVPANGLALAAFFIASRPRPGGVDAATAGLMAGFAVMLHYLSAVPALVMIPLYLALTGAQRRIGVYFAVCLGFIAVTILLIRGMGGFDPRPLWAPYGAPHASLAALLLRGLVGLGQCTVAGSALLRFEPVRTLLAGLFPHRMLGEEFFQAARLSLAHGVAAAVTLGATGLLFLYGAGRAWRALRAPGRRAGTVPGGRAVLAGVWFWFLAHALLSVGNQPGKPESWLMAMVPLGLLFCGLFVAPLARANKLWVVLALLAVFGLHNGIGGLLVVRDPAGDYNAVKSAWIRSEAGPGDLVVTGDTQVFVRYLRYHSPATIVDLHARGPELPEELRAWPGRVFVLHDVFSPPPSLEVRFPGSAARAARLAELLRPNLRRVANDEFGGGYEWWGGEWRGAGGGIVE